MTQYNYNMVVFAFDTYEDVMNDRVSKINPYIGVGDMAFILLMKEARAICLTQQGSIKAQAVNLKRVDDSTYTDGYDFYNFPSNSVLRQNAFTTVNLDFYDKKFTHSIKKPDGTVEQVSEPFNVMGELVEDYFSNPPSMSGVTGGVSFDAWMASEGSDLYKKWNHFGDAWGSAIIEHMRYDYESAEALAKGRGGAKFIGEYSTNSPASTTTIQLFDIDDFTLNIQSNALHGLAVYVRNSSGKNYIYDVKTLYDNNVAFEAGDGGYVWDGNGILNSGQAAYLFTGTNQYDSRWGEIMLISESSPNVFFRVRVFAVPKSNNRHLLYYQILDDIR